jgi:hypothetical protein
MGEVMQPIKAYKFLWWSERDKLFYSPVRGAYKWYPGWNVIDNGPFDVSENGGNGFYSFKDEPTELNGYPCVVELEIAGKVVEYQFGYRSEYARIVRIVNWQLSLVFSGRPYQVSKINAIYEADYSTDRCRGTWPKITPNTRVYVLPDYPLTATYRIPIMSEFPVDWERDGADAFIPYKLLEIRLDTAY